MIDQWETALLRLPRKIVVSSLRAFILLLSLAVSVVANAAELPKPTLSTVIFPVNKQAFCEYEHAPVVRESESRAQALKCSDNTMIIGDGERFGVVRTSGEVAVPATHRAISCFRNGAVWAPNEQKKKWCPIGPDGRFLDAAKCLKWCYPVRSDRGYVKGAVSWKKARELACRKFSGETGQQCHDSLHSRRVTKIHRDRNSSLFYIIAFQRLIRVVSEEAMAVSTPVEYDHLVYRIDAIGGEARLLETTSDYPDYDKWLKQEGAQ